MTAPIDPYTGQPRITRYHDSKALGDVVYLHELDRYSDQQLVSLGSELEATMPERWWPLHRKNHQCFLEFITATEARRKAA